MTPNVNIGFIELNAITLMSSALALKEPGYEARAIGVNAATQNKNTSIAIRAYMHE